MTIKMLIEEDIMNNTYQEVIIEHKIIFNCDSLWSSFFQTGNSTRKKLDFLYDTPYFHMDIILCISVARILSHAQC